MISMNEFKCGVWNNNRETFMIGAFRSRQQVLLFIDNMKRSGASARIINTPHEIKIGCGLSAAFDEKYYDVAKKIVRDKRPTAFVGFYKGVPDGVRVRIEPAMRFLG